MEKQTGFDTLYLTVYNVDPPGRRLPIDFHIDMTEQSNFNCYSCNGGDRKNPDKSCVCE